MLFILLESDYNVINPVVPRLSNNFKKDCIKTIKSTSTIADLEIYKKPPLFELGWFLIYSGTDNKIISFLGKLTQNVTVIKVSNVAQGEQIAEVLINKHIEFKLINNLKISKKDKLAYIMQELQISDADCNYLYNRTRGYLKDLISAINSLKNLQCVTRQDIKTLVPKTSKYGLNNLYNYLIGVEEDMTYEQAVTLIYKYRYGLEFLREFLLDKLRQQMLVFKYIASGELTFENYKVFKSESLTSLTTYQLYKMIEQYKIVSFDLLYFLFTSIEKIPINDSGTVMLLNIFRLRKVY